MAGPQTTPTRHGFPRVSELGKGFAPGDLGRAFGDGLREFFWVPAERCYLIRLIRFLSALEPEVLVFRRARVPRLRRGFWDLAGMQGVEPDRFGSDSGFEREGLRMHCWHRAPFEGIGGSP